MIWMVKQEWRVVRMYWQLGRLVRHNAVYVIALLLSTVFFNSGERGN
jgi:hypothetical protein